jgi:hypothetical protein
MFLIKFFQTIRVGYVRIQRGSIAYSLAPLGSFMRSQESLAPGGQRVLRNMNDLDKNAKI